MLLILNNIFLSHMDCALNAKLSFCGIREVQFIMTVGTKSLQIIEIIVFSVLIFVMNNKTVYIQFVANIAFYYPMLFNRYGKSFCCIIKFSQNASGFTRANSTAKSFYSALKFNSSGNYFTALLAWLSFNASLGTIFWILSKAMRPKWFFACFANNLFFSPMFIRTRTRAAQLLYTFSQIFKWKRHPTNNTIFHVSALEGRIV